MTQHRPTQSSVIPFPYVRKATLGGIGFTPPPAQMGEVVICINRKWGIWK